LAIDDLDVRDADVDYRFKARRVYNVDCKQVVREGGPPSGAHSESPGRKRRTWCGPWHWGCLEGRRGPEGPV